MYVRIGNNSGPQTLVRIVEVSVIGGVRFRRFHCIHKQWLTRLGKLVDMANSTKVGDTVSSPA